MSSTTTSINVKVSNAEGEIRRFSTDPSFAALKASLASRFEGENLRVTYKDDSDDDVCLSNEEDLETALQISGSKPLRLKVTAARKDVLDTQALENLRLDEHRASDVYVAQPLSAAQPLQKQFKIAVKSDPSLLALMQDPALGAQEKAQALPSPQLQQWFLDNQHVATEKLAKLQMKMDCGRFGRAGGFGKGKGGGFGKCGKGKGKGGWDGKGGPNHHVQHATNRLQQVLSKHPEIAQQLLSEPHNLQPLEQFHKLHHFCTNHPELLREQLELFRAAQASTEQQWVPMRHRIVRYLSNHDGERAALRNGGGTAASIDAVMANKPGMLRFLQSNPTELPALLDEADAVLASRAAAAPPDAVAGEKRAAAAAADEKKEKQLAEKQLKKAKRLEHKQLKMRVKVVKYLVKHPKELALLRSNPTAEAIAKVFAAKPKLKLYLLENAEKLQEFVDEAVAMSADAGTSSSSDDAMEDEEDAVVVVNPCMEA